MGNKNKINLLLKINGFSLNHLRYLKGRLVEYCLKNITSKIIDFTETPKFLMAISEKFDNFINSLSLYGKFTRIDIFINKINEINTSDEKIIFLKMENQYILLNGFEEILKNQINKTKNYVFIISENDFYEFLKNELKE